MKSDGAPEGTHRSSASDQWVKMGIVPKAATQINEPECPPELLYLWRDFVELACGLAGGFGPPVVTWEALDAWCRLTGVALEPWEARTLIRLGQRRAIIESEEGGGNGGQDHNRASRPH
jgi:hypothetical protein